MQEFCYIMQEATREDDDEIGYKETFRYFVKIDVRNNWSLFRVFAKDEEGCIHPDEIKFVLKHLPSDLEIEEIEEMIEIVDKNKDGKISYSEFRVRFKVWFYL